MDIEQSDLEVDTSNDLKEALLRIAELEKELQFAKLDLEETRSQLTAAQHDLNLHNQQGVDLRDIEIREKVRGMFQELSGPLTQLLTQNHIQHVQGKPLQTKDVNATVNRLVSTLKNFGLEISEDIGSTTVFDPNKHEALTIDDTIDVGEEVLIRMYGIGFEGKILRRAAVSRLPKP
ncbi:MAG: nucleotide exchange factor GrpE [Cyanobacteria bacterium SZAS-4]|nr:nucleotide exchange factor GrpE [Cyanobacteria bacterium SZAS-4]